MEDYVATTVSSYIIGSYSLVALQPITTAPSLWFFPEDLVDSSVEVLVIAEMDI